MLRSSAPAGKNVSCIESFVRIVASKWDCVKASKKAYTKQRGGRFVAKQARGHQACIGLGRNVVQLPPTEQMQKVARVSHSGAVVNLRVFPRIYLRIINWIERHGSRKTS